MRVEVRRELGERGFRVEIVVERDLRVARCEARQHAQRARREGFVERGLGGGLSRSLRVGSRSLHVELGRDARRADLSSLLGGRRLAVASY